MNINSFPYFDNNATTPLYKEVIEILNEYHLSFYANPSSSHPSGMVCNALYQQHKKRIADILNVSDEDIIFTSGATESINTFIRGIYFQYHTQKNHIISCKTEHAAVLQTLEYLKEYHHASISLLNVNKYGEIDLDELEKNITEKTLLICIMAANNETGVIHPIQDIYKIAQKHKALFFSDTTQLFGKANLYSNIPSDAFCGSAHKFHGPKGIGFLVIKNLGRKIFLHPLISGGQQQKIRSGTIPLPLIAGLSKALEISISNTSKLNDIEKLRDYFETELVKRLDIKINGKKANRIVNTSNILFSENDYDKVLKARKKFCFSSSSACSDNTGKPSHVLKAMGLSDNEIKRSFRFSYSSVNNYDEVNALIKFLL